MIRKIVSLLFGNPNTSELQTIFANDPFLVDVRTASEYREGSVKGSVNIPLDVVQKKIHEFKNKKHIVVFCRSGNRSEQAKSILKQNGFTNVTNGGTWKKINKLNNGK